MNKTIKIPKHYNGSGVYIIKCSHFYKIGYAKNIHTRFQSLQTANPFQLELVLYIALDIRNCKTIEKELHNSYKNKFWRGEWYTLNESDIEYIEECYTAY